MAFLFLLAVVVSLAVVGVLHQQHSCLHLYARGYKHTIPEFGPPPLLVSHQQHFPPRVCTHNSCIQLLNSTPTSRPRPIPIKRKPTPHQRQPNQRFPRLRNQRNSNQRHTKQNENRRHHRIPPCFIRPRHIRHLHPQHEYPERGSPIKNKSRKHQHIR